MAAVYEEEELRRRAKSISETLAAEGIIIKPRNAELLAAESISKKTLDPALAKTMLSVGGEDAFAALAALERAGLIKKRRCAKPIKSSGGQVWSAYLFAFDSLPSQSAQELHRAIAELDASITENNKNLLLARPWIYGDFRVELNLLSDWLRSSWGAPPPIASEGERCYEIWGNEKMLDAKRGKRGLSNLLNRLGFDRTLLRTYSTAETKFMDYLLPGAKTIVVSENLDFFHGLRSLLRTDGAIVIDEDVIEGAIFGSGWSSTGAEFDQYIADEGIKNATFLYVGDIDPAGIAIASAFTSRRSARLFTRAYRAMVARHIERRSSGRPLNRFKEDQSYSLDLTWFTSDMIEEEAAEVRWCVAEHVRIPQEIVTAEAVRGMRTL